MKWEYATPDPVWKFRRTARSLEPVGFRILDFSVRSLVTIPTTVTPPDPHYFVSISKPKAPYSTLYMVSATAGLSHTQKVTGKIGAFQFHSLQGDERWDNSEYQNGQRVAVNGL